jgi:hypothetical protein
MIHVVSGGAPEIADVPRNNTKMGRSITECEHSALSIVFTERKVSEGRSQDRGCCKLFFIKNYSNGIEYFQKSSVAKVYRFSFYVAKCSGGQ